MSIHDQETQRKFGLAELDAQSPWERAYGPLPDFRGRLVVDPDLALPSTAGVLPWRLFYFSDQPDQPGPFGYGRRASWPLRLCQEEPEDGVTIVRVEHEDGLGATYADVGEGFAPVSARAADTLVKNGDGSWDETRFETGAVFHFPPGDRSTLAYYQTVHGRRVTLHYDSEHRLQELEEPAGRRLQYQWDAAGEHVERVTDWAGRAHEFMYNGSDELVEVRDPSGASTLYQYDAQHRLVRIQDPAGYATTFTYDVYHRVTSRSVAGARAYLVS